MNTHIGFIKSLFINTCKPKLNLLYYMPFLSIGKAISEFKHNSFVTCGKFHPENTNIFVTGEQNTLRKWDCRCSSQAQTLFLFKDKIGQVSFCSFEILV